MAAYNSPGKEEYEITNWGGAINDGSNNKLDKYLLKVSTNKEFIAGLACSFSVNNLKWTQIIDIKLNGRIPEEFVDIYKTQEKYIGISNDKYQVTYVNKGLCTFTFKFDSIEYIKGFRLGFRLMSLPDQYTELDNNKLITILGIDEITYNGKEINYTEIFNDWITIDSHDELPINESVFGTELNN